MSYKLVVVNGYSGAYNRFVYVNVSNSFWSIFIKSCLSQGVNWKGSFV